MSGRRILLVEPAYRSKYPPLGLMKIAAYHKQLGDEVTFTKGTDPRVRDRPWDRIYITTLFSFDWDLTVKTISFYKPSDPTRSAPKLYVGGIAATILKEEFHRETGIEPVQGCLNAPGALDPDNDLVVDQMVPDYSILADVDYEYPCPDAYIGYATRGCTRKCRFCAVPRLEPEFVDYIDIKRWVEGVRETYGEKQHLLLLDNNVLASPRLADIVADIKDLGFKAGARLGRKSRYVDFNQGLDARLLTKRKMDLLAKIPINPFRLAYDNIRMAKTYERAIRIAAAAGVRNISTYVLYNYRDTPEDFWARLHHNVKLSEELDIRVWSFPMKYIPVTHKHRRYIGPHWNARFLRSIQCITLVTGGAVSARHDFFHAAFGGNHAEFREILSMPERYIIYRNDFSENGAAAWRRQFRALSDDKREQVLQEVSGRTRSEINQRRASLDSRDMQRVLRHYTK